MARSPDFDKARRNRECSRVRKSEAEQDKCLIYELNYLLVHFSRYTWHVRGPGTRQAPR